MKKWVGFRYIDPPILPVIIFLVYSQKIFPKIAFAKKLNSLYTIAYAHDLYIHSPPTMNKTIMIVEDNELCSEMYRYKLEKEGFNLIIKRNGIEALSYLAQMDTVPDLVLLDLDMPVMDGFETLKAVRTCETLKETRIIVFSSLVETRECCIDLGANDFIAKMETTPKQLAERLKTELA